MDAFGREYLRKQVGQAGPPKPDDFRSFEPANPAARRPRLTRVGDAPRLPRARTPPRRPAREPPFPTTNTSSGLRSWRLPGRRRRCTPREHDDRTREGFHAMKEPLLGPALPRATLGYGRRRPPARSEFVPRSPDDPRPSSRSRRRRMEDGAGWANWVSAGGRSGPDRASVPRPIPECGPIPLGIPPDLNLLHRHGRLPSQDFRGDRSGEAT